MNWPTPRRSLLGTRYRSRQRGGYTLLELSIVLVIILMVGAMSWPALMRPWARSRVQQAAQEFGRTLQRARLDAIESGEPQCVRWSIGSGDYRREGPPPRGYWTIVGSEASTTVSSGLFDSPAQLADTALVQAEDDRAASLPDGVIFVPAVLSSDDPFELLQTGSSLGEMTSIDGTRDALQLGQSDRSRDATNAGPSEPLREGLGSDPEASGIETWSEPIWFYPDGHSSTQHWTLRSDDGYEVRLSLRGFTGSYRVGPVQRVTTVEGELDVDAITDPTRERGAVDDRTTVSRPANGVLP